MLKAATCAIFLVPIVTAKEIGFNLAPLHSSQGTSRINPVKRSRLVSESASSSRRVT